MSTRKYIDRVCIAAVVLSLLLTLLFMNGEALGLQAAGKDTASGIIPAASTMPSAMAQKRKAMSSGSLMAVRKRPGAV